jgi:hypothetical protein
MTISSIPDENGYVEPAPAAWADLNKLTAERDALWERVKVLESEGDVEARRRADAAERYIETLTKDIGTLKAEAAGCWEIRKALMAEIADMDKAFKDAMKLVVHLATKLDD